MTSGLERLTQSLGKALAVALALFTGLWAASGVVLSLIPHDLARGERAALAAFAPALEARNYASPGGVIAQFDGVTELRLKRFLGRIVWEARGENGAALFDARTATRLSPLDEPTARMVAERAFAGSQAMTELRRLEHGDAQVGDRDVWRATFADGLATRVYVSAASGEVIERRNRLSWAYDGLQVLYAPSGKGGVTSIPPLLAAAAACAILLGANWATALILRRRAVRPASKPETSA